MDDELLAVELVPSMQDRLESLVVHVEESPHSNLAFYSVMGYMDALLDIRVFPHEQLNAARNRIKAAVNKARNAQAEHI